ncbi:HlyD family secretion protein [Vibrio sp.]|uniref:HlyD family secretion protein n=1 Tax=Vibrio viridaestus TaxID=2487322 RepID=A0A3N9TGX4_9VIBR|nr:HlyD family secretion protein [Vibrio viridaestus]MDC0611401.1 HlyD family secretion protein [Vibrio sp.]RQW62725.1 HlyD family secretion protein [Vibrio viridaestus]
MAVENQTSQEQSASVVKKPKSKLKRNFFLFALPVLAISGGVIIYLNSGRYVSTDNAYVKSDITSIAPEIAGRVKSVSVKENESVKSGQLLFTLDKTPFEIAVEKSKANLNDVKTDLLTMQANYESKKAEIAVAKSQLSYLHKDELRQRNLLKRKYISQAEFDAAQQKTEVQALQIKALGKQLQQIKESLTGLVDSPITQHPKYQNALAELNQAQNDLTHVNIYAPTSGIVTKVLETGQFVSPGSTSMMLVSDHNMWIEANFTESDMTHVKQGQPVDIEIDYAPNHEWHGTVTSIAPATGSEFSIIPAQNATGNWVKITQRIPVRIHFQSQSDAPELRAGLSAVVTIDTGFKRQLSL